MNDNKVDLDNLDNINIYAIREELHSKIKNNELNINESIKTMRNILEEKIESICVKSSKLDKDKEKSLQEFSQFKQMITDQLYLQDNKINNLQKSTSSEISKCEKLIKDNFLIPGLIGEYCQYKNLSDYIKVKASNIIILINKQYLTN